VHRRIVRRKMWSRPNLRATMPALLGAVVAIVSAMLIPGWTNRAVAADTPCGGAITLPVSASQSSSPLLGEPTLGGTASVGPLAVVLSAGRYAVSAGSDAALGASADPNQRWYAVFLAADGTEVGRTAVVADLETGTTAHVEKLDDVVLRDDARSVTYVHQVGASAGSVVVRCLAFTPMDYPIASTSTTTIVATTTTIVATTTTSASTTTTSGGVASTTAAPTTKAIASVTTVAASIAPTSAAPGAANEGAGVPKAPKASRSGVKGTVAFTGAESVGLASLAAGISAVGVVLVVGARRRRQAAPITKS
jgi:hypothetical protein